MYDESSIKVLNHLEIDEMFVWRKSRVMAEKYNKPHKFVEKLLESCERLGMDSESMIQRYLVGDRTVERNLELEMVFKELLKEGQQ